jgi:hypothetical protein
MCVGVAVAEWKTYSGEEACRLEDGIYERYRTLAGWPVCIVCTNEGILPWQAVDERQEDAISGALKQLNEKRNHLEENMRLSNDLKVWCYRTFQECMLNSLYNMFFFHLSICKI